MATASAGDGEWERNCRSRRTAIRDAARRHGSRSGSILRLLDRDASGSKVVVGDGPTLERVKAAYPGVYFLGAKHGPELALA